MIIDIIVPSPGESINEVQIANWLVENGSGVAKDSEIVEVDSDKATLSISAEASGKIEILIDEGETVEVGSIIAKIETDAEVVIPVTKVETMTEAKSEEKVTLEKQPDKKIESEKAGQEIDFKLSPLARKLMEQEAIDPSELDAFYKSLRLGVKDIEFFKELRSQTVNISGKQGQSGGEAVRDKTT